MAVQTFFYPVGESDLLRLLVGLANGFFLLLVGAIVMLSVKRCLPETMFLLLTLPAFATCAILVSFYLYAFGSL